MAAVGKTRPPAVTAVEAMADLVCQRLTWGVQPAEVQATVGGTRLKVPCRQAYAKPVTVARATVGEMGKGYGDKASLWERCYSRSSMAYGTPVQGVQEDQGEQGADSVGQAGVRSRK
jgi:hypothetical protein